MSSFKKFSVMMLLPVAFASVAFATEQDDDSEKATVITATSNPATIERNASTANKLKVSLPVVFKETVCTQTAVRQVFGPAPACGYTTVPVYRCYGSGYYPVPGYPGGPYYPGPYNPGYPGQNCSYYPETRMNSCMHDESYCAQYGVTESTEVSEVVIKFRKNTALSDAQTDRFELSAAQKSVDSEQVDFQLKEINTQQDYVIVNHKAFLGLGNPSIVVKSKK